MITQWQLWRQNVWDTLLQIPHVSLEDENFEIATGYKDNQPLIVQLPEWPILRWRLIDVQQALGDARLQFQYGRSYNDDYEFNAPNFVTYGTFGEFLSCVENGPVNNAYIVAQNHSYNREAMMPLYNVITPLPTFLLPDASAGYWWIGGRTITPLHHDKTNNFICQVMGAKVVRMVAPDQFEKLSHRAGVHSNIGWLTDQMASERHITYTDFFLIPGRALFVPVGWWHCIQAYPDDSRFQQSALNMNAHFQQSALSMTVVYTNFIWPNNFMAGSL